MARKNVSTTVYLDAEQLDRLSAITRATKVPMAERIRQAIDQWLDGNRALEPAPTDDSTWADAMKHFDRWFIATLVAVCLVGFGGMLFIEMGLADASPPPSTWGDDANTGHYFGPDSGLMTFSMSGRSTSVGSASSFSFASGRGTCTTPSVRFFAEPIRVGMLNHGECPWGCSECRALTCVPDGGYFVLDECGPVDGGD